MSVEFVNETSAEVDAQEFVRLARFVLDSLHVHPQAEVGLTLVDEQTMSGLHERWMGEPGATDVLAFPMDEVRPGEPGSPSEGVLGDVVICTDVAAEQAATVGHSAMEEMELLAIHGLLHLLGFDHAEDEQEKEMFDLQRRLLLTFLADEGGAGEGSSHPGSFSS
ncbi:MAG: rRNA maturation RNase YbeY [Micrococcales bacterium]|nr:rRNA maturation RNase YbeY [Micrococcales bacterium]